MNKFCRFCGKELDSDICDCPLALQERSDKQASKQETQAPQVPLIPENEQVQPPIIPEYTPPVPEQVVPDEQIPYPPLSNEEQSGEPAGFTVPPQVSQTAERVGGTVKDFVTNPFSGMDNSSKVALSTSFILLTINIVSIMLFLLVFAQKLIGGIPGIAQTIVYPAVSIAFGYVIILAVLFIGAKLSQSSAKAKDILGSVSLFSLPGTLCTLLLIIITLLLGSSGILYFFLVMIAISFTGVISVLLLDRALAVYITSSKNRVLTLSIAIAMGVTITIVSSSSIFSSIIALMSILA